MIDIKSKREIELMRVAGKIVAELFIKLEELIKPGATTLDLDKEAYAFIKAYKAEPAFLGYGGFPATLCTSVNEVLIHGIPNRKPLQDGDIVSIDVGAVYDGYYSDAARTYPVGKISEEAKRLLKVAEQSFAEGLKFAQAGNHLGDISAAIGDYLASQGYQVPLEYTGHGIGSKLHEAPAIPNYGIKGSGVRLKAGMALAIEPMVLSGSKETRVASDKWAVIAVDRALTAHYENTVLITEDKYEILTI